MPPVEQGLHGCTLCSTKDFCYFSSLKSKETPIPKQLDYSAYMRLCSLFQMKHIQSIYCN
ncbi:hypothetical protein CDG55_15070 [Acinetobacter sp. WCHA45]|nr:hypothetical protein CDG55_15070 [Acinetobacter sp. WCHA45]